jgi:hypothetical protein
MARLLLVDLSAENTGALHKARAGVDRSDEPKQKARR